MRPKCERGWHWSGRRYLCGPCFEQFLTEARERADRWKKQFRAEADAGIDSSFSWETFTREDATFAAHYNRHPPTE